MSRGQIIAFCVVASLVMAFGLLCVIQGKQRRRWVEQLRRTGHRAVGVVVDYTYRTDTDGDSVVPYPLVQFPGPDGRLITAESDFGGSYVPDKGDEVPVLFDPSQPETIHLEHGIGGRMPTILGAIGWAIIGGSAIALLVALLLYFVFWDAIWGPV